MLGLIEELGRGGITFGRQEALKLDKKARLAVSSGAVPAIIDQRHVFADKCFHL